MSDEQFNPQDEEIEIEAIGVEVSNQPIELYKVLKIASAVSGGGEAKHVISEGYVFVNGEVETRKRCKIFDGDLIEFNQEFYVVICDAPVSEPELETQVEPAKANERKRDKSSSNSQPSSKKQGNTKSKPAAKNRSKVERQEEKSDQKSSSGRNAIRFF
ncbi:RNA-binding S4 domain-containing protein [Vibrio mimicus]|nr:RNA-binding S4 domain-containing protein [Vibrio mimicus]QXC55821.1 RNA-binding S4 domain-containing protein [Vibrio mimicus]